MPRRARPLTLGTRPPPVACREHRVAAGVADPHPPTPRTGRRVRPGIHVADGTATPIRNAGDETRPASRSAGRSTAGPGPAPGGSRTSNTTGSDRAGRSPGSDRSVMIAYTPYIAHDRGGVPAVGSFTGTFCGTPHDNLRPGRCKHYRPAQSYPQFSARLSRSGAVLGFRKSTGRRYVPICRTYYLIYYLYVVLAFERRSTSWYWRLSVENSRY